MKLNLVAAAAGVVLVLSGCASVPEPIQTAPGQRMLVALQAEGSWVYNCRLSNDGKSLAWASLQPEAVLKTSQGEVVGQVSVGPNFTHKDGSVVESLVKTRVDSPDAGMLPWVLFTSTTSGPRGAWSDVVAVQQVKTVGGGVPRTGCTAGDDIMSEQAVPFKAEYRFFTK